MAAEEIADRRLEIDNLDLLLATWQRRLSELCSPRDRRELTIEWADSVVHLESKIEHLKDLIRLRKRQFEEWMVAKEAPISELIKKACEISGIPDDEIRLNYSGKEIRPTDNDGKGLFLQDFNLGDLATIFLVLRLHGGSETGQPKMYDSEVTLTYKPDMFTLDDEEGGQRAEMPCGHAIGPESLTAYCRSLLDAKKYEFRCPYKKEAQDPECGTLWELFTVKRLAVLTVEEIKEFETKIAENYLRKAVGIQECPKCQSFCERRRKKDVRVICPVCTRDQQGKLYEFCWCCLKTWLGSGTKDCGNLSCTGKDPRLRIVQDCPKKVVVGVPGCPAVRMCPQCGMLIEHRDRCKHMDCPCGQKFCFICLNKAVNGRYTCGAWNVPCAVAPIQSVVPGD